MSKKKKKNIGNPLSEKNVNKRKESSNKNFKSALEAANDYINKFKKENKELAEELDEKVTDTLADVFILSFPKEYESFREKLHKVFLEINGKKDFDAILYFMIRQAVSFMQEVSLKNCTPFAFYDVVAKSHGEDFYKKILMEYESDQES